jgi:hypothetical protein
LNVHTYELAQASNSSHRDRLSREWEQAAAPTKTRMALSAVLVWAGRRLAPRSAPRPICVPARLSR